MELRSGFYASGDPVNNCDPDGRCAKGAVQGLQFGALPDNASLSYQIGYGIGAVGSAISLLSGGDNSNGNASNFTLQSAIDRQTQRIQGAMGDFDLSEEINQQAYTANQWKFRFAVGQAVIGGIGAGVEMAEYNAQQLPTIIRANPDPSYIPIQVFTSNGTSILVGTPAYTSAYVAANGAMNAGALGIGVQTVGNELIQKGAESGVTSVFESAEWVLDPAGKSANEEMNISNGLSRNLSETIQQLQNGLKWMKARQANPTP